MTRCRVTLGGVVRWVHVPDDWSAALPPERPPFRGLLDRHPDIDRCPRCGSWRWQGSCTALHHLTAATEYRAEQDGRRGRRIPSVVDGCAAERDGATTLGGSTTAPERLTPRPSSTTRSESAEGGGLR